MSFELQSTKGEKGTVTVSIKGDIDMSNSPKVREVLTTLFRDNMNAIVVDLSGVSYIDSSGIATLVEGLQWSHNSDNKFRLACMSPAVKDIFKIARLLTLFEVYDSPEEALKGFS
jgi:anti-sigma B factor antagonist